MRGGFLHSEVIVCALARAFEEEEWDVATEVPVRIGDGVGYVDLLAERDGVCVAVEVECSARRVGRDLDKAQAVAASELWIVVPGRNTAASVRRALHRMGVRAEGAGIFVLTQGAALQRVRNCLPLFAGA